MKLNEKEIYNNDIDVSHFIRCGINIALKWFIEPLREILR